MAKLVPVDSDIDGQALPAAEPTSITLSDGRTFEYDQTMEVFRTMQVIIERVAKEPELLGRDEPKPAAELGNVEWALCFLWAITYPSRKAQGCEDMAPVDFLPLLPRAVYKRVNREMVAFLREMNPDPNADGL